jgi:hypothetical protein
MRGTVEDIDSKKKKGSIEQRNRKEDIDSQKKGRYRAKIR